MSLFSRKKEIPKKPETQAPKAEKPEVIVSGSKGDVSSVLSRPRVTEKATSVGANNVYVFNVHPAATKERIAKAVFAQYKVQPVRVNVVTIPRKKTISMRTRKPGISGGGKKAYVYLKEGDKIEFV